MKKKSDIDELEKQQEFIRTFVNAVYAVLLGYGFSQAIKEIYDSYLSDEVAENYNSLLYGSFIEQPYQFQYALVFIAMIVLCVHWWDWRLGVSNYITTDIFEFIINILILLNIEWLFFEYKSFENFAFLMTSLAFFNFVWVLNFRIQRKSESDLKFKTYIFQRIVIEHIIRRFLGFILYAALFIIFLQINSEIFSSQETRNWIGLFLLFVLFIFDRLILYRNRKLKNKDGIKITF